MNIYQLSHIMCVDLDTITGIRVVSNAGGINPLACAAALREAAKKADVDIKVAVVTGDDIISQVNLLSHILYYLFN